jgi:hypothetical protein
MQTWKFWAGLAKSSNVDNSETGRDRNKHLSASASRGTITFTTIIRTCCVG